jgi:hypothetical protein
MSQLDNLLNTMLGAFAYSIIVVPVAFLIIFAALYYFKPKHRLAVGITAITLGSIGLAIYSLVLIISLIDPSIKVTYIALFLVIIEILTICIGFTSVIKRNPK